MFPHLFSPLTIGGVTLANRVVSSGHDTVMADHGQITDRLVAYHEARARGGAGLIVVQVAGVHETARYTSLRLRFLREAFESIRRHCGRGFVAGLRISLDERDPAGLPTGIALAASVSLAADGLADYLNVTTGTSASLAGSDHIAPDMTSANGYVAPLAGQLRAAVNVPVLVAGRINQPQEAEHIIAAGQADACVMTRALICDPGMPRLARAGQTDDIRACIGCNQACIGHFHLGFPSPASSTRKPAGSGSTASGGTPAGRRR